MPSFVHVHQGPQSPSISTPTQDNLTASGTTSQLRAYQAADQQSERIAQGDFSAERADMKEYLVDWQKTWEVLAASSK
ncbi:hypothetical protein MN608_11906 [Microdochium nivale]|nr:hypothetical protein MN608_11906 [Microdochium nivale]